MKEDTQGRNDWAILGGVAVGAVIALLVGPPLVGGVAIGLCLGLLFSPKAGRETRRDVGVWVKRLAGKTRTGTAPEPAAAAPAKVEVPVPPKPALRP